MPNDTAILQQDLDSLSQWAHKWQIAFNASIAHASYHHPQNTPFPSQYSISNHAIQQATSAKYLRVILRNALSWIKITDKAN